MMRVTCPTCPLDRTYTSQARADYSLRQHSCAKQHRKAETAARTAAREAAVDRTPKSCAHTQVQHQHGTHVCYVHDQCRCPACSAANAAYEADRVRQHLYGRWNGLVDAAPAREHVLALMAQGMGLKQIVKVSGVSSGAFSKLVYGGSRNANGERVPSRRITPATAERVLAVKLQLAEYARTPSLGAVHRLQALVALGWSQHKIATRLGILPANFTPLILGRQTMVSALHDRAARALYDELSMQIPPQDTPAQRGSVTRAKRHAVRAGWAPPLAWDDAAFDDPAGRPTTDATSNTDLDEAAILRRIAGDRVPLTPAERVEVARRLVEAGWSQSRIYAQTGITQVNRLLDQEVA